MASMKILVLCLLFTQPLQSSNAATQLKKLYDAAADRGCWRRHFPISNVDFEKLVKKNVAILDDVNLIRLLNLVAERGNLSRMEILLQLKSGALGNDGRTKVLHFLIRSCMRESFFKAAETLMASDMDINLGPSLSNCWYCGSTVTEYPLDVAVSIGSHQWVTFLLRYGADPTNLVGKGRCNWLDASKDAYKTGFATHKALVFSCYQNLSKHPKELAVIVGDYLWPACS